MLKLLEFLWSGCWHRWEDLKAVECDNGRSALRNSWTRYYTRCAKCGAHKKWD